MLNQNQESKLLNHDDDSQYTVKDDQLKNRRSIIWINQHADFVGGAEKYIIDTASKMKEQGFRNILLYEVSGQISQRFVSIFDESFPMVDLATQAKALAADICYVHCLSDEALLNDIFHLPGKKIRFIHDHKILCPREHKYTAIKKKTCRSNVGLRCIACCGMMVKKSNNYQLISLSHFKSLQKVNQRFDRLIVASHYLKNELIDEGFDRTKISINPLYTTADDNSEYTNNKHTEILFVGQLLTGKGLDILIEAMRHVDPAISLTVCGSGAQEDVYKTLVNRYHLTNRVNFVGHLDSSQLPLKYQQALAVCIPSRAPETFCLTGLEALKYKTPVIAANVGGMSEWLKHSYNSLMFESGDIQGLSRCIQTLYEHVDLAQKLGEQGYNDVNKYYLPEHHVSTLMQAFYGVAP